MGGDSGGGASSSSNDTSTLSFHSYLLYGYDITGTAEPFDKPARANSMFSFLSQALREDNPYDNATIPSPTTYLDDAATELTSLETMIDNIDPDSTTDVDALVDAFEQAQEPQLMRSINRITGPMADINAAEGFAFIMGLTLLESEFTRAVANYRAQITQQNRFQQITAKQQAVALRMEYVKLRVVAEVDNLELEFDVNRRAIEFEMSLFEKPGNLLASLRGAHGGGQPVRNRAASALSGAFSGAAIGAQFGPVGAGVGSVLGGIGGLLS